MSARCLLIALFCLSAAVAYGPAMILAHIEPYCFLVGELSFVEVMKSISTELLIIRIWSL